MKRKNLWPKRHPQCLLGYFSSFPPAMPACWLGVLSWCVVLGVRVPLLSSLATVPLHTVHLAVAVLVCVMIIPIMVVAIVVAMLSAV
jgi:hypothetical protein